MSKFLTPLICQKVEGTDDKWKLTEPLDYQSDLGGLIIVPANFETDFASTPQIVWNFLPKDGRYDDAAVVHDFLYSSHEFPRSKCDSIFLEAMGVLGVPWYKRYPIFLAVRACGWLFYNK